MISFLHKDHLLTDMSNIILVDFDTIENWSFIAILKMELALTRGKYRDYYDLFADSPYFLVGF